MLIINPKNDENNKVARKIEYHAPQLVRYGALRDLTQAGTGATTENMGAGCSGIDTTKRCSERSLKENIVRIGEHPLGIGLYLFDYKPEYREMGGHGRQFGVMIDEVEIVMPEAVSLHLDGLKRVDYTMLGIEQTVH